MQYLYKSSIESELQNSCSAEKLYYYNDIFINFRESDRMELST